MNPCDVCGTEDGAIIRSQQRGMVCVECANALLRLGAPLYVHPFTGQRSIG